MKKMRKVGTPNVDSKDIVKSFFLEIDDKKDNNCPCWVCKEQNDKIKNIQRQNSRYREYYCFFTIIEVVLKENELKIYPKKKLKKSKNKN